MASQHSLKIMSIGGRTNDAGTAVTDIDQEEFRLPATLLATPGIGPNALDGTPNPDSFRVRQGTGSDMNVKVGSNASKRDLAVLRGTVAGQGAYIVRLDATTVTLAVPATDPSLPSWYSAFLYVNDVAYSGTAGRAYAQIAVLRGTPGGGVPAPSGAWSASLRLWDFQLAAGASQVTNAILDASATGTDTRRVSRLSVPGLPAGVMLPFAGPTPVPAGTLLCYGQAVSRRTYGDLFDEIGTAYGVGDGSTTFNLPDCRGVVLAGLDNMGGSARGKITGLTTLGTTPGAQTHTLSSTESGVAVHTHADTFSVTLNNANNVVRQTTNANGGLTVATGGVESTLTATVNGSVSNHAGAAAASADNNVQPTMGVNVVITI